MTTQEIQAYLDTVIRSKFADFISESGEMMTSAEGDGRFMGKVIATRYSGLVVARDIFLAIGETEKLVQIVKFGKSECLKPDKADLDMMLLKELGLKVEEV